jgi:hypothetical protein
MLKFLVYEDGRPAQQWPLRHAHLLGPDDVGVKGTVRFRDGLICCEKNAEGAAALALQVELEGAGELVLQTCLLPEREEPYVLSVELARHRLMRCLQKQEDWAMFELGDDHPAMRKYLRARRKFIEALSELDDPDEADRLGWEALRTGIEASERLALTHAESLLQRRRQAGQLSRHIIGSGVGLEQDPERVGPALAQHFDYIRLPMPWRRLEPEEQTYDWKVVDRWCEWAVKQRVPVIAGPLVSFTPDVLPDWLYMWDHDYDSIREVLSEHIERVVGRYRRVVSLWNVVSGIHVNSQFGLNFEQLMDLTGMAASLTKRVHPNGQTLIEITHPFGEYYASNQRAIPPLMYAEMVLQAGISFDAFGLKLVMGQPDEGRRMRDLMQVSALLDRFSSLGKPLHVSAAAVPSEPQEAAASGRGDNGSARGGYWRRPWSGEVQAEFLDRFYKMCLSKPFVDSVAWLDVTDHDRAELPSGGLLDAELEPKQGLHQLSALRDWCRETV